MPKARMTSCGLFMFDCPACGHSHGVPTKQYPHKYGSTEWEFNRDFNSPTLSPSLKVMSKDKDLKDSVCHFHLRNGKLEYCNDCTHSMSGKVVELPDIDSVYPYSAGTGEPLPPEKD